MIKRSIGSDEVFIPLIAPDRRDMSADRFDISPVRIAMASAAAVFATAVSDAAKPIGETMVETY